MHGQALPQFTGKQYFEYIHYHIKNKTDRKNHDPLLHGVVLGKNSRIPEPEQDNAGVERIDQETGSKQFKKITGIELLDTGFGIGGEV